MKISDVTGSTSAADNITSFFTFALGVVAGGFLVLAANQIDIDQGLRGDLLRVYLTLLTALLAGMGGLIVSRISDRIGDRRDRVRKLTDVSVQLRAFRTEIEALRAFLANLREEGKTSGTLDQKDVMQIATRMERCKNSATIRPDFSGTADDKTDERHIHNAQRIYGVIELFEPRLPYTSKILQMSDTSFSGLLDEPWTTSLTAYVRALDQHLDWIAKKSAALS